MAISGGIGIVSASHLLPSQPALLFVGPEPVNGDDGLQLGDGLRCAGRGTGRGRRRDWGPGARRTGALVPGGLRRFQVWCADASGPRHVGFNAPDGLRIELGP